MCTTSRCSITHQSSPVLFCIIHTYAPCSVCHSLLVCGPWWSRMASRLPCFHIPHVMAFLLFVAQRNTLPSLSTVWMCFFLPESGSFAIFMHVTSPEMLAFYRYSSLGTNVGAVTMEMTQIACYHGDDTYFLWLCRGSFSCIHACFPCKSVCDELTPCNQPGRLFAHCRDTLLFVILPSVYIRT